MAQKFTNAARAELASTINDTDTTITIVADGALFPVANTGAVAISDAADWFKLVLQDETGIEIVFVRTHTSASLSFTNVLRGQEGTTARGFASGSVVGLRPTAADAEGVLKTTFASQAEAEAGTVADKVMSPLRTAQAIAKLAGRALPVFNSATASLRSVGGGGQIENSYFQPVAADSTSTGMSFAASATKVIAKGKNVATTAFASSTDGKSFTPRTMPATGGWRFASDGSGFLASPPNSTAICVSSDGETFTTATALPAVSHSSQVFPVAGLLGTAGTYLVRTNTSTGAYLTTDNGSSFTAVTLPINNANLASVAGLFIAYTTNSVNFYTSPTGATGSWTLRTFQTSQNVCGRIDSATGVILFTCLATRGSPIYRVTDGINSVDTGMVAPTALAANNSMVEINGVPLNTQGTDTPFTGHAGKYIQRSGRVPQVSGADIVQFNGVYLINRGIADGTVNLIDPAANDAALGLFVA